MLHILCYGRKNKKYILLLLLSRFASCSKFFPSIRHLFSQFSRAGTVSWKGHKFLAFGLELAQPFLNTVPALKNLEKKCLTANLGNYRNKILLLISFVRSYFKVSIVLGLYLVLDPFDTKKYILSNKLHAFWLQKCTVILC